MEPVNTGHIRKIEQQEVETKFAFFQDKIADVLDQFTNGRLDKTSYPGGKTFQLLDVVYKLDYLLKPEGIVMESFENIHKGFFKNDNLSVHKKNANIVKELVKIQKLTVAEFSEELYEVLSTFGVTVPTSYEQYTTFAQSELPNMDWYIENKYLKVGTAIPSYIIGYALFNYALPQPLLKLFHLFYCITECHFFNRLGYHYKYLKSDNKLNEKEIKSALGQIRSEFKSSYPNFNPKKYHLNYQTMHSFSKSFLIMTMHLDLSQSKTND